MRGADTFTESLFTMRHLDDFGKRPAIPPWLGIGVGCR